MRIAALALLAACGSSPPKPHALGFETDDSAALLAHASHEGDAGALRRMLGDKVTVAGLWFADERCAQRFGTPTEVAGDGLDELARCLATLKLETTKQREILPDLAVMSYAPGIEVEARLLGDKSDPQLVWIGFSDLRDPAAPIPSITPEKLETLRDAGEPHPAGDGFALIRVCIDPTGHLASAQVRGATTLSASRAFEAAVQAWHFRPFVLAGTATSACALMTLGQTTVHWRRPAPFATPHGEPLLWPPVHIISRGTPATLSREEMAFLRQHDIDRVVGGVMFCVDVYGHVYGARTIRSTGIPEYDQELLAARSSMVFTPYRTADTAVAFCTQDVEATTLD